MVKSKKNDVDKRVMVKWTEDMDDVLIDAFLNQQIMGNRIDKVFTTTAYENVVKELHEKVGRPVEKGHLKNRLKTIKHNFYDCYEIFRGKTEFAWSPETKMWVADHEVWKALMEAKPDARKWMATPIANYDKLLVLFAKDKVSRDVAEIAEEKAREGANLANGVDSTDQEEVSLENLIDMSDGTSQLVTTVEANSKAHFQHAMLSKSKKRKGLRDDAFERKFERITEAIKDVAKAIREGHAISERCQPPIWSEQEVFAELVKLDVDVQLRYRAYTFLVADAGRVRAFFGCPAEERKQFMLWMMFGPEGFQ